MFFYPSHRFHTEILFTFICPLIPNKNQPREKEFNLKKKKCLMFLYNTKIKRYISFHIQKSEIFTTKSSYFICTKVRISLTKPSKLTYVFPSKDPTLLYVFLSKDSIL